MNSLQKKCSALYRAVVSKWMAVALIGPMLISFSVSSWSLEEYEQHDRSKAKLYRIGVYGDDMLPLWGMEEGEYSGFSRSLLDEFSQHQNLRFEYTAYDTGKQLINALKAGKVDFIFPANKHWNRSLKSRSDKILYSEGVHFYLEGVMLLSKYSRKRLSDLDAIGIMAGKKPLAIQDSADRGQVAIIEYGDFKSMFAAVKAEKIQGIYTNIDVGRAKASEYGIKPGELEFHESTSHDRRQYRLATIKEEGMMQRFDEFILENKTYLQALRRDFKVTGR